MTPEETQAALLADWLQSPPGTPAPEGIDEAVLAAVYTLRPDRAPPVRLSVDDILGVVAEGPLAAQPSAARAGASARVTGERATTATRSPLRRRAARAWWAVPGIGIVVTAAAAALIAIRVGGGLDTPSPELATFSEPSADKVAAAPSAARTERSAPGAAAPADGAAEKPAEEPTASTIAEAGPAPASPVADATAPDAKARSNAQAPVTAPAVAATSTAAPPPPPSVTGGTFGTAGAEAVSGAVSAADLEANAAERDQADDAGGRSYYQAAEPPAVAEEAQELAKRDADASKDERARAPAKSSAPARGAPASTKAPAAADEDAPASPAQASAASAMDYNPGFYASYPEIAAAYAAAVSAQSAGRYSDALAAYAGFRVSPHADVAQDASWRAAQCLRSLGRIDDALAVVVSGLRVSSSNTPYRSNLYNLQGELYSAQGKAPEAQRAWAEAARLNALR